MPSGWSRGVALLSALEVDLEDVEVEQGEEVESNETDGPDGNNNGRILNVVRELARTEADRQQCLGGGARRRQPQKSANALLRPERKHTSERA